MAKSVEYKRRLRRMQKKKKRQKLGKLKRIASELSEGSGIEVVVDPERPGTVSIDVSSVDPALEVANDGAEIEEVGEAGGSRVSSSVVTSETAASTITGASFFSQTSSSHCCSKCATFSTVKKQLEAAKFDHMKLETELAEAFRETRRCRRQLKLDEKRMERVEIECQRKICSIRSFWKDKIYRETTRAGKIVKMAMQKTSPY